MVDFTGRVRLGFIVMFWDGFVVAFGGAEPFRYQNLYAYPARGYFSVKKSNQKSLGEDPETPTRRYAPTGRSATSRIWG